MVQIHLPTATMTFLKPREPYKLLVKTEKYMNKMDIKSYFCSVYNVDPRTVVKVNTFVPAR